MHFRFHKFNHNKFSASKFLSDVNSKNNINEEEININTIRNFQLNYKAEKNKQIKKEIIQKNLLKELSLNKEKNNSDLIKDNLSLMLAFNSYLKNKETNEEYDELKSKTGFSNLISCFQLLMKYLFEIKENEESKNAVYEKKLNELKDEKNNLDKVQFKNDDKIEELENKIMNLKLFLNRNGVNTEKKQYKLYICDVCPYPYQKFYSYREFHKHYVSNHVNPNLCLSQDFSIVNQGFDKNYFDNKINEFAEDIYDIIRKTQDQNDKEEDTKEKKSFIYNNNIFSGSRRNKRYVTVGPYTSNFFNTEIDDKKKEIRNRIANIKNNQKSFEDNFKNQINNFLIELRNEISNLQSNQTENK
jgi:hypothetical protein